MPVSEWKSIRMLKRQISLRQSFPPDHIILPQMWSDVWHWTGQVYSSTEQRRTLPAGGLPELPGALNTQHPTAREGRRATPPSFTPPEGENSWWPGIVMTKLSSFILRKTLRSRYHPHVTRKAGSVHLSDETLAVTSGPLLFLTLNYNTWLWSHCSLLMY